MHIHFLDPYRAGTSPIHCLDGRIKLMLAIAFILTTALTPSGAWAVYILLLAGCLSAAILSGLGIGFVFKRSLLATPFILAVLPLPFTVAGHTLTTLQIGSLNLIISQEGVERFLSIGIKSWISVQAAILLASTTQFPDLLIAMRAMRLPRLLVAIIGLMWRYLFVMADEVLRLLRARAARSGVPAERHNRTGGSIIWRGRVAGGMAGSLFLRSLERSDRIYNAMLSRGYDGEVRTMPSPPVSSGNWSVLIGGIMVLLVLLFLGWLGNT